MKKRLLALLIPLLAALYGCGAAQPMAPLPQFSDPVNPLPIVNQPNGGTRWFLANNVFLDLTADIGLSVDYMKSSIVLANPSLPFVAEDVNSYTTVVHQGHVGLTAAVLTKVMNEYIFAYANSPLFNLTITFDNNKLNMSGTMHKIINLPFQMVGSLQAMPNGMIQEVPEAMYSAGVRVDGLLNLLGITMSDLINLSGNPIISIDNNSIVMNPAKMMPPPAMTMKVTDVQISNNMLWMTMDDGFTVPPPTLPVASPPSYVHIEGGTTLSGSLLIHDTNMTFLPISGGNHQLDFNIVQHPKQVNDGLSNAYNSIITLYVPDWSEVAQHLNDPTWRAFPGNVGVDPSTLQQGLQSTGS